jgi:hypothetical protein
MMLQVLQPDMGVGLPLPVRQALLEMGSACSEAANALQLATALDHSAVTRQGVLAAHEQTGVGASVAADIAAMTDVFHDQAIVTLARASASYASYASQVAVAVAADLAPPFPDLTPVRPSVLAADPGRHLPPIQFIGRGADERVIREQNEEIIACRDALVRVVTGQMQRDSFTAYDELAPQRRAAQSISLVEEFPVALHQYAAALVWALSVFSGAPNS